MLEVNNSLYISLHELVEVFSNCKQETGTAYLLLTAYGRDELAKTNILFHTIWHYRFLPSCLQLISPGPDYMNAKDLATLV